MKMRTIKDDEMQVLLRAAAEGTMDLNMMPGFDGSLGLTYYAQCTKNEDGSHTWAIKYLPIVNDLTWTALCLQYKREPIFQLTNEEKKIITQAALTGEIDEEQLPRIYPLQPKPFLCDVNYTNFENINDRPQLPIEWIGKFVCPVMGSVIIMHDEDPDTFERMECQKDVQPIDRRNNSPIDERMACFYDVMDIGLTWLIKEEYKQKARNLL